MNFEKPTQSDLHNVKEGAEELERLNNEIETASNEEERKTAFNKAIEHEQRLNELESSLGLDSEEAHEALNMVYEGAINGPAELEAVLAGDEIDPVEDKASVMNRIKELMPSLKGKKRIQTAALFLMVSMGTVMSGNQAFGGEITDIDVNSPEIKNANAGQVLISVNKNKQALEPGAAMTWQTALYTVGMPDSSESLHDYLSRVVEKNPSLDQDVDSMVDALKSGGYLEMGTR